MLIPSALEVAEAADVLLGRAVGRSPGLRGGHQVRTPGTVSPTCILKDNKLLTSIFMGMKVKSRINEKF